MIPIGDADRRPLHLPIVTALVIGANAVMFLLELAGGDAFINRLAMVPADIVAGRNWITILTAMFMHAGWAHILGNMVFFWVFGPEIEDVMGPVRYLIFYLLGGLAATVAQAVIAPNSTVPNLGASGAIAAVMGAFLITYPRDRIRTVLLLGWFARVTFIPAVVLVGFWFLTQLFSEIGALAQTQTGGVAYMAHIGGFVFGAISARLFETRQRRTQQGLE
ncbi:MAG: rhomboid family intramembrane serine protease [Anaerolineales bacterium]|nr:MAG: rhomboid family intramembrane serine protease [Anaerolineales bacterium]